MDHNDSMMILFELLPSIHVGITQQSTDKNANIVSTNISYISQRREPSPIFYFGYTQINNGRCFKRDAFERKRRIFMNSDKNFSNSLVEEILVDVADTFFATRRHLEEMMDMLQSFVKTLREKEAEVASRAGFLHYLLLHGREAGDFYKSIKVDSVAIVSESNFSNKAIPEKIPFAFTTRGKFIKLVLWAYDVLQKACDEYINGKYYDDPNEKMGKGITVHYNQIVIMC